MMFRIGFCAFLVTVLVAAFASFAHAAVLNQNIVLKTDVLTVGDIFTAAGEHKDHVLGPAPKPGDMMVLDAKTLHRIARTFAVDWKPARGTETVVVRRSSAPQAKAATPETVVSVPVLARPVTRDEVITASDVIMKEVSSNDLKDDTVMQQINVVGLSARGLIQPDMPISANLLVQPKVIKRNQMVTVSLNSGRINLTSQAKALHDARIGDIVRLQNTQSEKIVQARVTGPQEATIDTAANQGG